MINYINRLIKKIHWYHFVYIGIFFVFFTNTLYVTYPDEFVNILGGKFINMGKVPYKDFFDHHLPGAWYLSAILQWFSFGSYVLFRIWWAVFAFCCLLGVATYIKKSKPEAYPFYLGYFILYPFISVYYWTHLFVADSLAFLFFSVLFWLLIVDSFKKESKSTTVFLISLINFFFVFSSLAFIYVAIPFYLWMLYLINKAKINLRQSLKLVGISIAPYIVYGVYLLLSNSWKEFYISNVVYNTTLYINIPNFVKGPHFNPIKFALTLIFNFYETYIPLLVRIKEFNLFFPVDLTIALGSFILLLFLFLENKILFLLFFIILSFSAPRSNLMKIGETDYQSGMFIALGFISVFVLLWRYKYIKFKEEYLDMFKKTLTVLLLFFLTFASLFLVKNTYDKFYLRYTLKMPGIYNIAYSASFIDEIIDKGDYFWIGPYEPNEEFFVKKGLLPGKFPTLLPQFREDDYFKSEFIKQFETHPPKIIIYKHDASIFMTPAMEFGAFFVDWMKGKYSSIEDIKGIEVRNSPTSFNLKTDLYLLNEDKSILLKKLQEKGYLK